MIRSDSDMEYISRTYPWAVSLVHFDLTSHNGTTLVGLLRAFNSVSPKVCCALFKFISDQSSFTQCIKSASIIAIRFLKNQG